jgi:hypothetical protein
MLGAIIVGVKLYLGVTLGAGAVLGVMMLVDHLKGRARRWTA